MIKRIFFALVCLMAIVSVNAQNSQYYNTKHEVGISVGYLSTSNVIGAFTSLTKIVVSGTMTSAGSMGTFTGFASYGSENYIPTVSAEYFYHVNGWLGVGGLASFNGMSRNMYSRWKNNTTGKETEELVGKAFHHNFSLLPAVKFDYLRRKNFGMYAKAGLGVTMMFESQRENELDDGKNHNSVIVLPNIQLSLLGLEFGSENWRGFTEFGIGEQGFALIGLKYKF